MSQFPILTMPNGHNIITIGGRDKNGDIKSMYTLDCKQELETCHWKEFGQLQNPRSAHVAFWLPENIDTSC